jgi:hypothetical protein
MAIHIGPRKAGKVVDCRAFALLFLQSITGFFAYGYKEYG